MFPILSRLIGLSMDTLENGGFPMISSEEPPSVTAARSRAVLARADAADMFDGDRALHTLAEMGLSLFVYEEEAVTNDHVKISLLKSDRSLMDGEFLSGDIFGIQLVPQDPNGISPAHAGTVDDSGQAKKRQKMAVERLLAPPPYPHCSTFGDYLLYLLYRKSICFRTRGEPQGQRDGYCAVIVLLLLLKPFSNGIPRAFLTLSFWLSFSSAGMEVEVSVRNTVEEVAVALGKKMSVDPDHIFLFR